MLAFSDKNIYNDLITMLKKVAFSMAKEQTEKKMDIELENPADFTRRPGRLPAKSGRRSEERRVGKE